MTPRGGAGRRRRAPSSSERRRAAAARILIVEDEPDLVRGLRDALEFEGFEIVSSGLGREGVKLARERGARSGAARPDAARHERLRRVRGDPRHQPGAADHHADGALAGDRQDPRPRRGRRRLRHQAVLDRRAGGAHQRHLPAPARAGAAPDEEIRIGDVVVYPRKHELVRKARRWRCRSTRSSCCACCTSAPASR